MSKRACHSFFFLFILALATMPSASAWIANESYEYRYEIQNTSRLYEAVPFSINDSIGVKDNFIWTRYGAGCTGTMYLYSTDTFFSQVVAGNDTIQCYTENASNPGTGYNATGVFINYVNMHHFDNNKTADSSPANNDATDNGTAHYAAQKFGDARHMNAAGLYVLDDESMNVNDTLTVLGYFKTDGSPTGKRVIERNYNDWSFLNAGGDLTIYMNGGGQCNFGGNPLSLGSYVLAGFTYNRTANNISMYSNTGGNFQIDRSCAYSTPISYDSYNFYIGTEEGYKNSFPGLIDELMIINDTWTFEEVRQLHFNGENNLTTLGSIDSLNLPNLTVHSPINTTYRTSPIDLEATVNYILSAPVDSFWFELNGNGTNITFIPNTTIEILSGINNITVYANVSSGEVLTPTTVYFYAGTEVELTIIDEDTGVLINNETTFLILQNLTTLEVLENKTTTTGTANFSMELNADFLITGYTNGTYTHQRRLIWSALNSTNARMRLLQDGRGLSQTIEVLDRTTYQAIEGAVVYINYSTEPLDVGITDSEGVTNSYLDVYKLYTAQGTKDATHYRGDTKTITPTGDTYTIYLSSLLERPPLVRVRFNPSQEFLNPNKTYIPMVTVEDYTETDAMSFIIAAGPKYLDYYRETGTEYAGLVTHESFNFTATGPWCNATILCSIAADNVSITFRYSPAYLGDYGNSIRVTYNWSEKGRDKTDSKGYLMSDFKLTFADQFTDTQKLWVGFGIVFFGLFLVTKELVGKGYNPSIKALGFIAWVLLLAAHTLGFFSESFAIVGTLLYVGGVSAGRVL